MAYTMPPYLLEVWRWLSVDNIFELNKSEEKELKEAMEILRKYYEEMWLRNLVNLHRA